MQCCHGEGVYPGASSQAARGHNGLVTLGFGDVAVRMSLRREGEGEARV